MTSSESQSRKENTVNSKKQETLNTLRKKWNWESAPAKADKMSFILDRSRKDYEKVVGEDGIGLARYQSECLAEFGIGTFEDVTSAVALEATVAAVEAVEEVFDGYPAGTVTRSLGDTVAETIAEKVAEALPFTVEEETGEPEFISLDAPANIPVSFLKRVRIRSGAFAGAGILALGCLGGTALVGYSSTPSYAWGYTAPVEGQSLVVASYEAESANRDGIGVATAAQSYAAASMGGNLPYVDVSAVAGNSAVLASAMKYVGVKGWDCTMLVEQALRDLGYSVGDLAPTSFGSYGTVFYDASAVQPGDIMMRGGHVAIYAGDGMGVHGGYNMSVVYTGIGSEPSGYTAFVRVG